MQDLQAGAQIADADARGGRLPVRQQGRAVIVVTQSKVAVMARPGNSHGSSDNTLGYAVLDGVFHQGLQQEARNLCAQQLRRDIDAHL